ncbi:MAG: phosphatase PAP2 family protein [Mesorhizobium sp.]
MSPASEAEHPDPPVVAKVAARSLANLVDTLRIVRGRFARRQAAYPRLPWALWIAFVALLAALSAFFLDAETGRYLGHLPAAFGGLAGVLTLLGLGQWYLLPPAAWLLVANQIDWRGLPRRRLMAAYDRTSLAFFVLAAVGLPGLAVNLVKIFIGRARPTLFAELGAFSFHPFEVAYRYASFPSGHATTMGSVAAVLMLLFPRARYLWLAVCMWIASTRIFVGAHYPSDTVAGFGLGFGLAVLTAMVFARLGFLFRQMPAGLPVLRPSFRQGGKA